MSAIVDVLRGEGLVSTARRAVDRLKDALEEPAARPLSPRDALPCVAVPVFLPEPLARRHGGVSVQLAERLAGARGSVALLTPRAGGLRLDLREGARRRAFHVAGEARAALALVLERLSSRALHVEGAARAPVEALLSMERSGMPVVLSLHDFGLFCERPHLAEEPSSAFCGFSRDGERCARCLGRDGPDPLGDRRRNAGRLLEVARAVVFPSTYLRDAHRALFPGERLEVVIEPAAPRAGGRPEIRPRAPRHVAFVGRLAPHKGSRVFAAVCASLAGIARFTAIGSGERPSGLPARAYGFYRPGSLPSLLARLRVDLALLPSIVPEAFGLTLSECWAAGVPALAFDHGALAERIRRHGGGRVVPLGSGGEGLSREIGGLLEGRGLGELAFHDPPRLPSGEDVARAHDALHERLGLV